MICTICGGSLVFRGASLIQSIKAIPLQKNLISTGLLEQWIEYDLVRIVSILTGYTWGD